MLAVLLALLPCLGARQGGTGNDLPLRKIVTAPAGGMPAGPGGERCPGHPKG